MKVEPARQASKVSRKYQGGEMAKVKVEYEILIPLPDATDEQIEEWLRFELHDNGDTKAKNPLGKFEPEPIFGTFDWHRT